MNHVTDVSETGGDAQVLTETAGGLISRPLLHDEPLAAYLDDGEEPQYVLRNKKRGVRIERPAGTEAVTPDGRYSTLALVSDVRVLFVVGGQSGDRAISVALSDLVDVRTDDGMLGGTLVLDTVDDERYRFPCRGDIDHVADYLDAAVGVWARAEKLVDRAQEQHERLTEAFESGDIDVVLAAVDDATGTLDRAREEADALASAKARISERAAAVESDLRELERRAHAEQAEQLRERVHVRWDDGEYELAFDHLDDAAAAYEAAMAIDAGRPSDELLERRGETLESERERLADAPVDKADQAAEVAAASDDPGAAIDWWETALDRYETALSLDWGREDRRFNGDPERIRAELVRAAESLVEAYCDLAREHIEAGDDALGSEPETAATAYEFAAEAVEEGASVARERAPDAMDEVAVLREALEECREDLPETADAFGTEVDGGPTMGEGVRPIDDPGDRTDREGPDAGGHETVDDWTVIDPDTDGDRNAVDGRTVVDPDAGGDTGVDDRTVIVPGTERSSDDTSDSREGSDGDQGWITDAEAVDPGAFVALVAEAFRAAGWSATVCKTDLDYQYDLLVEAGGPVDLTVGFWVLPPGTTEIVEAPRVERIAASLEWTDEADASVLCSAVPLSTAARERAAERGLKVLDPDGLAGLFDRHDIRADWD
jgi:hypothetical protein